MPESKKIYNEIREKLKQLNDFDFPKSVDNFNTFWEDGIQTFKTNLHRLNEGLNFETIYSLPDEVLILLSSKLDLIKKDCDYLLRVAPQKNEYFEKITQHNDALKNESSVIISKNGKTLNPEELITRRKNIEKILKDIDYNLEHKIEIINRKSEEIYYIYCVLLEQTKSPIRAFFSHSMENFYKSRTLDFESKINNFNDLHRNHIEELENQYSSLFERFKILDKSLSNSVQDYQKLQEVLTNVNLKVDKEIQNIRAEYEKRIDALSEKFRDILINEDQILSSEAKKITDAHSDFIKIVENAGIYSLTENYSKKAAEEKIEYKAYRRYTSWAIIAAIFTTIIILGLPIYEYWGINPPVNTNYFTILARLTVSVMFFVLAVYLSKQAAKHYECYQENHKTFLQLAALEPFISRMSDEDKLEIRKALVPIYFSQDKDGKFASKGDEVDIPPNMANLIGKLIDRNDEKKDSKPDENTSVAKPQP